MTDAIPISAVILSHNEAENLPRCLAALAACGEVVVLDDGSADDSQRIARDLGARVVEHAFASFADQRNWAMDHAALQHDWVLHLDADEVATPEMMMEIRARIAKLQPSHVGWFARKVMLDETWLKYSADYPVFVPRLVHREGPRFYMRGHGEWMDVAAEQHVHMRMPMLHYSFSRGWDDWWRRHERYSSAEAARILQGLPSVSWKNLLCAEPTLRRAALRSLSYRIPGRPMLRFLYSYFFKLGFLDGRAGLTFCQAMSRYEKMIDRKVREGRRQSS